MVYAEGLVACHVELTAWPRRIAARKLTPGGLSCLVRH